MIRHRRAFALAVSATAAAGVLAWGVWRGVESARFEGRLARARAEAGAGRFASARAWLITLPPARAADPRAADLLGACEHALGKYDAALAAWRRIPPGSPLSARAELARAQTLAGDLGRFAEAETLLESVLKAPGPERVEARHALSQLYFWEFRAADMRRITLEGVRLSPDPAAELRDLWLIDDATTMIDTVREVIETAARRAPEDDRVWLARAGLDLASGRLESAARWLDLCERERPNDPAVWRARLDLGRTRDDVDGVRVALARLPADALSTAELYDLRAWLAARRGDRPDERAALEKRAALGPEDPRALERLAALAWEAGDHDRAAELRRRKSALDPAKDRYRRLLHDRAPLGNFPELARLAEQLGRTTEAQGWWRLAYRQEPGRGDAVAALARLRRRTDDDPIPKVGSLAERLASLPPRPDNVKVVSSNYSNSLKPSMPAVDFRDDARAAGLDFVFENGRSPLHQLPETTSGGVGLLDFDGDGFLDVYAIQGGAFPPDPARPNTGDRLFRNRGDGTFEDASGRAGIAAMRRGYGHGISVGDVDNDGDPDLFLTRWRSYALYRNRGDGTFEDVTEASGLGGDRDWPTSSAFADLDGDGDLDLYVCHYVAWDATHPTLCPGKNTRPDNRYGYCMPNPLPSSPDHLFRNDGGGRFVDVTAHSGVVDTNGRGLGVVASDVDGDGRVDLFVANDTTANYLFRNLGGMKFEEIGVSAGVACNADGAFQAGMGTAVGDLDGDGLPDLLVTNFYGESTTFFRNLGGGMFGDQTASVGLSAPSRFLLGFGLVLFDANNDGRLDLASANGHVNDNRPDFPYEMPALLMLGTPDGRLVDASRMAGEPWRIPRVGRGLAAGDMDNDGRADLVLVAQGGPLAYLHNTSALPDAHFLTLRLEGTTSNRDAVGAVVTVRAGGTERTAWRTGGGSYQSSGDPRLHVGLGPNQSAEAVDVRWPSGRVSRFGPLKGDAGYRLREGETEARPLAGFKPR